MTGQGLRRLAASVLFCVILFCLLAYAGAVLKPTRSLLAKEGGSAWSGYLEQPRDSVDVLFFGNSHVYCGVDPIEIWKAKGITSYVLAGPVQQLGVCRRYIAEALRTQHPKVVAIEMSVLPYDDTNYSHPFQLVNVGYMPWGVNKLLAGLADTKQEDRSGALVDLWAYHGRWAELTAEDFSLASRTPDDGFLKGFLVQPRSRPVTSTVAALKPKQEPRVTAAIERNLGVLRAIARDCEANDAQLLLFLTPTAPPGGYTPLLQTAKAGVASVAGDVKVLDLDAPKAVPALVYRTDFNDDGHLSTFGAEKASAVLAAFLAQECGVGDHRGDPAYAAWDSDAKHHDAYIRQVWAGHTP